MIDEETKKIRLAIQQWCREWVPNIYQAKERNEAIINNAMKKFGITRKEAEYNFIHNNDLYDY